MSKDAPGTDYCTLIHMDERMSTAASAVAIQENIGNLSPIMGDTDIGMIFDAISTHAALKPAAFPARPPALVVLKKLWAPARKLRVYFFTGSDELHARVMQIAKIWEGPANIEFEKTDDRLNSDIRVGFYAFEGHKSYLGTDCLLIARTDTTMNLDGRYIHEETPDQEMMRVVLHEFGHALGFGHSHKHPNNDIPWDKPKVYDHYWKTQGWPRSDTDYQVLDRYTTDQVAITTEYDKHSCMQYAVPNELTEGDWEIGWNVGLSDGDKADSALAYPR